GNLGTGTLQPPLIHTSHFLYQLSVAASTTTTDLPTQRSPLDALPSISSGSPGLGSSGQWLVEGTAGSLGPGTSYSLHVSEPIHAPLPPPLPRPRSRSSKPSSKPLSTKPAPNTKLAALTAQPSSLAAPVDGSSSHHNLSSGSSSSNNAANQGVGIGGYPVSTMITSSYRKKTKLTLLNPMSLLMRRRSPQASGLLSDSAKTRNAKDLPGDFDPGIIYGTRHPDWSNPPKRGQHEAVRPPVDRNPLMDPNNKLGIGDREYFDDGVGQDRGSMVGKVGKRSHLGVEHCLPLLCPRMKETSTMGNLVVSLLIIRYSALRRINQRSRHIRTIEFDGDGTTTGDGIAGYGDDDDDLYFDDGIILNNPTAQSSANNPGQEEGVEKSMNKEQRDSFPSTLGISSGGAMQVEYGSLDSLTKDSNDGTAGTGGGSGYGNKSFPPFLNPIGAGLGCTQQAQFYAPDGTMLDGHTGLPLALSTLTQQLYQYRKRQQREAEVAVANEINSPGALSGIGGGGYYSIDDDEYEQENADDSMDNAFAGRYFGRPAELASRPTIRKPCLTPISERSESSYRNREDIGSLTSSNSGGGEITREQLMHLRRDAWGGSNGSLRSSRGSGTHSPVPANSMVGTPPGLSNAGKNEMLPTKTSFQAEVATTESGSRNGRSTADGSYASAVGSPIGDYEVMDAEDGNGGREGWGFSPIIAAAASPSM
ncbi:hypothetical protein B9Z19DRAFT_1087430, partial [Tuber borchii]